MAKENSGRPSHKPCCLSQKKLKMTKLLMISLCFPRFMKLKVTVLSRLLKKAVSMALWTMASLCVKSSLLEQNLPRTPSRPKTSVISVISVAKNLCNLWLKKPFNPRNPRLINDLRLRKITYEKINFFCKTNPNSEKVK